MNYGTGSPEEAVALWAYLDGSPSDTTSIAGLFGNNAGDSEQWNTTTKAWVSESWNTVGYWASLAGRAPSQPNDGLNFLHLDGNGTTTIYTRRPSTLQIGRSATKSMEVGKWTNMAPRATRYRCQAVPHPRLMIPQP